MEMNFTGCEAREWARQGKLAEWIQRFLRSDAGEHANPNPGFADGLLLEERFYIGPVRLPLSALRTVRVEEDLSDERERAEFMRKAEAIGEILDRWDMPPFLVQYREDGGLYLTDGNHRFSALRRAGAQTGPAIVWGSACYEAAAKNLLETISAD